jgi:hypothetical protein
VIRDFGLGKEVEESRWVLGYYRNAKSTSIMEQNPVKRSKNKSLQQIIQYFGSAMVWFPAKAIHYAKNYKKAVPRTTRIQHENPIGVIENLCHCQ